MNLYFKGLARYSPFRQGALLRELQSHAPHVQSLTAHHFYVIDTRAPLDDSSQQALSDLLQTNQILDTQSLNTSSTWRAFVSPRNGTISPWSSKATEIALRCQLTNINRIEHGAVYELTLSAPLCEQTRHTLAQCLHDPLTETLSDSPQEINATHQHREYNPPTIIDILNKGKKPLEESNQQLGLQLSGHEIQHLYNSFVRLNKNPTHTELMMFAQVNSEHCRHNIFNANWTINNEARTHSLFDMIKNTVKAAPNQVKTAYKDNAAVIGGHTGSWFIPIDNQYQHQVEPHNIVLKVETHNHPTAISPMAGAATGSGGEIRDEAATGRGAYSKAGLCGFMTGHLHIPGMKQPWELDRNKPPHLASALDIMLQGPIGAAAYNNEFGRPNIHGFFRTFDMRVPQTVGSITRSYYKPIMIAGGIGAIREDSIDKQALKPGNHLIVLGGPAMNIGLGGGGASSNNNTDTQQELDFASVQRANPEMQRRAQEVINRCWSLGDKNPIISIHDVGAGGLSNALPEIIHTDGLGAEFKLNQIPTAQTNLSPMEIWCNESQERYVLAIETEHLELFDQLCRREQCPYAIVGEVKKTKQLILSQDIHNTTDETHHAEPPTDIINIPMATLFEDMPSLQYDVSHQPLHRQPFNIDHIHIDDAIDRTLQFPCVADKSFLITIADRSVGGLVSRDSMVGPWQVPVSDVAVTCTDFKQSTGEAFTTGERPPIALLHPAASARMAVGEALTNIAAAPIDSITDITLSANWMNACGYANDAVALYDAVQAIGMELCPALGINIPVGKDSLSMQVNWSHEDTTHTATAPLSLVITAAAPITDVRKTLTPQLTLAQDTTLLLIDLAKGSQCLGGSVLSQVYQELGQRPADFASPIIMKHFFELMRELHERSLALAYHDRSDGGLITTLLEMAFASHCGLTIDISPLGDKPIPILFNEELGVVIQINSDQLVTVQAMLQNHQLLNHAHVIGTPNTSNKIDIQHHGKCYYQASRVDLQRTWSRLSYHMQARRDNPACAEQAYDQLLNEADPGLTAKVTFDHNDDITAPYVHTQPPRMAILREQGVNGHVEMAAAFDRAGFRCFDIHMSDLLHNPQQLEDYQGLAVCGGFSFGDTLGAGRGWAQSILRNASLKEQFQRFFHRENTFTLGVCNGCQMLSHLQSIIPGADHWPTWTTNQSEQFEARLSLVRIPPTPSIILNGMEGSVLPVVVSHAEGRAASNTDYTKITPCMQYVDNQHRITEDYPANPNGSAHGLAGVTTTDGRVTIMMPHPERVFRQEQLSWKPNDWHSNTPWLRLFQNAKVWLQQ